ncbi:MAG: hypothetical protein WB783_21225 [Arenicellales bacterium]
MLHDSAIDRCIDDLSSALELARALEQQLELVHKTVSKTSEQVEAAEAAPS